METFEYLVLSSQENPQGPTWAGTNGKQYGINLPAALNQLGKEGWELVAAADVTRTSRVELFFKRKTG